MIRTIFFDLDDTLLDFRRAEAESLKRTLPAFEVDPAPAVLERYHEINAAQWRLLEEGKLTREQVLLRRYELLFAELEMDCDPAAVCDLYEENLACGHWFIPGAEELLETLAPRYDLYLATNGTAAVQHSRLNSANLKRYFKGIFISEEVGADKPGAEYFRRCFAAISGFDPAFAIIVGDSLTSDIRGGQNAGIRTCWFNPGGKPPRPDIRPDCTIRTLSELPALLETL